MKKKIGLISLFLVFTLVFVICLNNSKVNAGKYAEVTGVTYKTHVQDYGWQKAKSNGETSGTTGEAKRLESIQIKLDQEVETTNVRYCTHVEDYGWQNWVENGEVAGTEGRSKRIEAIRIELSGQGSSLYDIYYRVHVEDYGWQNWVRNGELAGTTGKAKRIEAIEIKVEKRKDTYISYQTHVEDYGWQSIKADGEMAGTSGKGKRLEAIVIGADSEFDLSYRVHVEDFGWNQGWVENGELAGTTGKAKRLEAIEIKLSDEDAQHYDINYRVHVQDYGWQDWVKNGETAGTTGKSKRLEAIEIYVSKKYNVVYKNGEETYSTEEIHGEGLKATKPATDPTKLGYTFDGWEMENGELYDFNEVVTEDMELKARWTPVEYKITYTLDRGRNNEKNPKTYTIESNDITLETPVKAGYIFLGWTNSEIEIPKKDITITQGSTGDKEFTANWARSTYYVIYTSAAGEGKSETKTDIVGYNDDYVIPARPPVGNASPKNNPDYYDFCWMGSDGKKYTPGRSYSKLTKDGLFILTPMFKAKEYKISYNLDEGELEEGQVNYTKYSYETDTFTLINPTRKGYAFKGWSGTGLTGDQNQIVTIPTGSKGTRSYTANWVITEYGINYDYDGGLPLTQNPNTYDVNTPEITLNNPIKTDYVFTGWTGTDLTEAQETVIIPVGSTGDRTYTANWRKAEYTVKYLQNAEDVSGISKDSKFYTEDSTCSLEKNPFAKEGYTFKGWSRDPEATEPEFKDEEEVSRLSTIDGEVVNLYAVWKKTWVVNNENELTNYNGDEVDVVIPDEVDGIKITAIKEGAFASDVMETLTLSENITKVEDNAITIAKNPSLNRIIMTNAQHNYAPVSKELGYGKWTKVLETASNEIVYWEDESNKVFNHSVIDTVTLVNVDYNVPN